MKKVIATVVVICALFGLTAVASAERGDIGGIGTNSAKRVVITPAEHDDIGGVGVR